MNARSSHASSTVGRLGIAALLATAVGCGAPAHVAPFKERTRAYKPGEYAQSDPSLKPSSGSLFSDAHAGFLEDTRAVRVGDVVVINIDEAADASGDSSTKLNRDTSMSTGAKAILGLIPALKASHPDIDPEQLISYATQMDFSGEGNTRRKGELSGRIAVRVVRELPNGDLFIEGTKVILLNNEEYHLYISGIGRRTDIGPDNSIASSRIADAQIEFTGRGDLADTVERGWLGKIIDTINPF